MLNDIAGKLRRRAGESIAETLIALLISALALTMLAGAISTVGGIVNTSNQKMKEYYADDEAMAQYSGTATSINLTISGSGISETRTASGYNNSTFGNINVMAYQASHPTSTSVGG